mgnify:CR=1 FL=1
METEKKKSGLLAAVQSREEAEKLAKDCSQGFYFVAALQGGIGIFIAPALLFDAAVYALCGYFIGAKHSRTAAVIVFLLACGALATTVMNRMGQKMGGGNNIILAGIVLWMAARSIEATFKLAGRYRVEPRPNAV